MSKIKEFLILNTILPLADLKFHTEFSHWYKKINQMILWTPDEIKEWQRKGVQNLIKTAYEHSKYYHDLFKKEGLTPDDIKEIKDLEKIPPLTKDIIRERFEDILLDNHQDYYFKKGSTGGSSGNPTQYIKDNKSWGFDNAFNTIMWKRTGYHYGDKFLALGSSSLFPTNKRSVLHEWFYKMKAKVPFNAMNLSEDRLEQCVKVIQKNDIHYIYGYASSIFLLAKYVYDKGIGNRIKIKACFPTSEILTETYRETIHKAFNCIIDDSYGANDGGIVAHKIDGEYSYKVGYNCIVQINNHNDMNPLFGSALLTDITNVVFPFIRYELGDELELGEGYDEFYNGQVLKRVVGRTSDVIKMENGSILTSPGFTILFKDLNVKAYRIYKSNPLEITIEIVKAQGYQINEEKLIINTFHKHAGEDVKIIIEYKDSIITRQNGKNLFFLSGRN